MSLKAWLAAGLVSLLVVAGVVTAVVWRMDRPLRVWSVSLVPLSGTIKLENELETRLQKELGPMVFERKTALGHVGDLEKILVQASGTADLVVAIGADVAQAAYEAVTGKPVVCCRVPYPERYGLLKPREGTSPFLVLGETSPAAMYCAELKKLKNAWGEAGVILPKGYPAGEEECKAFQEAYRSAFGSETKVMTIDARTCAQLTDVVGVYNMIQSQKVDLYYAINDGNIAKYLGMVVEQCRNNDIPVIAGGEGVLNIGGILTIDPDVGVVADRCAETVKRVLSGEACDHVMIDTYRVLKNEEALKTMNLAGGGG